MKFYAANDIQTRILQVACALDCENIQAAKQGKASKQVNDDIVELMFAHEFIPYWNTKQIRQVECFLNEKFKI